MAKKHKAPDNNNKKQNNSKSNGDSNSGSASSSSSIFKTLFGDIPEQSSLSIFSDDNPFRRKPSDRSQTPHQLQQQPQQQQRKQPVGLGFGSAEDVGNTESPNFVEAKKRKRDKEKKRTLDSDSIDEPSETPLQLKKSKRDEPKSSDLDVESEVRGEGENKLAFDSTDALKRGKGKKLNFGLESGEASKRGKGKDSNLGMELEELPKKGGEDNQNMVMELKETETRDANSTDALKRGKGKKLNFGLESGEASKRGKGKDSNLGMELEELPKKGGEDNQNMVMELKETETRDAKGTEKKNRKKRRREEELEAEYEARRLGFVTINDEGGEGALGGGKLVGKKRKNVDDPVAMVVSKEGFDDEAKLLRTVFVGNLSLKVKKKSLLKEFSQFGEVESVRIRSVPLQDSKKPRKGAIIQKKINDSVDSVHAYIVFKTEQSAQASLAHNMAVVGGNHIRVDRACPPRKKLKGENSPLYDSKRTVFVGNLPFDVKDEEIYQLFSGIKDLQSSIEAIRVIRDPGTSVGKGIAYILFKTRGAANLLVKKRSLKLRDRELRLTHARSNLTPSKRKNQSPRGGDGSPSKKFAVNPRTPDSYNNRVKTKDASSYQGLRASKSGVQKKVHPRFTEPVKLKYGTHKGDKPKERSTKRPAVAARKAANALNGGGSSKQTGKKRKLENRTPQSARSNNKTKKFR